MLWFLLRVCECLLNSSPIRMLYVQILLIALRPFLVSAIAWNGPAPTIWEPFPEQLSPVETAAPELRKRDVPPSSVCGYFPIYNETLTCAATNYCGFNTAHSSFGCCNTYTYGTNDLYSLFGCFEPTTCYETSPTGPTDTSALYWCVQTPPLPTSQQDIPNIFHSSKATASKCISYELSVPGQVYYALGCSNVNGLFQLQTTPEVQNTAIPTIAASSSGTAQGLGSVGPQQSQSSSSGDGGGNGVVISSMIPPTQTQKSVGSQSTATVPPLSTSKAAAGGLSVPKWGINVAIGVLGVFL
ncbi:hypothetical protein N431DRAFT_529462 [Stipitochalara longipes BDJ]|nr:hypothetical protein N431DRAFT_529462 [Stipitochalara longipes BDJ]